MTLSYCCHIISQIEIEYSSTADLPKWIIHAFKNPRVSGNFTNLSNKLGNSSKNHDLKELYSICDSFLKKFGYSMKHLHYYDPQNDSSVPLPISDSKIPTDDLLSQDLSSQFSSSSDSDVDFSNDYKLNELDSQTVSRTLLQNMITKTMVYYLSLYEEFSKNYDLLNISKKSSTISKNSTYEMISGLRDCVLQLYESNDPENEAIIITNDYSGIFSSNDILITRSNVSFRDQLKSKGVSYMSIYDEIKSYSNHSPLISKSDNDFSELVSSYLNNKYKTDKKKTDVYNCNFNVENMNIANISKFYMLKSLKLPISDEYDLNVIRIIGRSNCHKLFKMMDKSCMNSLLSMKNEKLSNVRLILTNFPTLFSKVNQARVSVSRENAASKIVIRGLIMPSVLMSCFNIVKIMEKNTLVNSPTVKIKYNQIFDNEMYEKTLRISDNRIYEQFMNNFGRIKHKYKYSYKALKKLVPFNRFTINKGKVTVIPSSSSIISINKGESKLSLENHTLSTQSTQLATTESLNSSKIVIVKDILYFSLSKISLYLNNIEGATPVKNQSTKAFLDDSLSKVSYTHLKDITYNDDSKCYLELYPNNPSFSVTSNSDNIDFPTNSLKNGGFKSHRNSFGTENKDTDRSTGLYSGSFPSSFCNSKIIDEKVDCVLTKVSPNNLVSVVWVISYLLHRSGHSVLLYSKSLQNITSFDIYSLNVLDNPLKTERDVGKFDILKTLNFPLSQQSYFIHLVNHINFNKDFYNTFKVKYKDYLNNPNATAVQYESEKINVLDQVLNLKTGWSTYFKHKSTNAVNLDKENNDTDNKDNNEENKENKEKDTDKENSKENGNNVETITSRTSSWNKRLRINEDNRLTSENKEPEEDNKKEESDNNKEYREERKEENKENNNNRKKRKKENNKQIEGKDNKKENKKEKIIDTVSEDPSSQSSMSISSSFNVDFGTVYTSSRKHGRVHQCQFNFDTTSTFDEMFYNDSFNIIDEFNSIINKSKSIETEKPTHYIIVFIYSNEPKIMECVNYCMIRNVLKSNLVKFSNQGVDYGGLDLDKPNQVNVNKFIKLFTNSDFCSGSGIYSKNGVCFSLFSSDFSMNELYNILNQIERTTNIKMIGVPLHEGDMYCFTKSCMKLIRVLNVVRTDYFNTCLEFVSASWIFDSYFEGMVCLDSIPEEYVLNYTLESSTQYSLDDFSIQDFKEDGSSSLRFSLDDINEFGSTQLKFSTQETNFNTLSQMNTSLEYFKNDTLSQFSYSVETLNDTTQEPKSLPIENLVKQETHSLVFRDLYKDIKYFWGWTVYILTEGEFNITSDDCILYRKYCGIVIKKFEKIKEIQQDIEESVKNTLMKFNITDDDVEEYLIYDRILINTVVITGINQNTCKIKDQNKSDRFINPMIKSKKICFGAYEGIPVMSNMRFVQLLNSNLNNLKNC